MVTHLGAIRHDWTREEVNGLFALPFAELIFQAHCVHRQNFDPNEVQISTLLSIKTGACPEDCGYCSQSGHHNTGLQKERLMPLEDVIKSAQVAKQNGATRFCMGAAWRNPREKDLTQVIEMIKAVRSLGMESCVTLGMLTADQAKQLKEAGLDYYNHNLDTSPEYYPTVTSTRTYQDRLDTLEHVRNANIHVCCGGILGMGENFDDRVGLLLQLANLSEHPKSVPINLLVAIKGTPLGDSKPLDPFEFIRNVAVARILLPKSHVRLSAGRGSMNEQTQALCFFAGANSIHYGEKLLTTPNPDVNDDQQLFAKLGIKAYEPCLNDN